MPLTSTAAEQVSLTPKVFDEKHCHKGMLKAYTGPPYDFQWHNKFALPSVRKETPQKFRPRPFGPLKSFKALKICPLAWNANGPNMWGMWGLRIHAGPRGFDPTASAEVIGGKCSRLNAA